MLFDCFYFFLKQNFLEAQRMVLEEKKRNEVRDIRVETKISGQLSEAWATRPEPHGH